MFLRSVCKAVTCSMAIFPWCLVSQWSTLQSSRHAGTMSPTECLKSEPFCKLDVFPSMETKRKNSRTNHVERSSNQRLLSFEIPVAAFACLLLLINLSEQTYIHVWLVCSVVACLVAWPSLPSRLHRNITANTDCHHFRGCSHGLTSDFTRSLRKLVVTLTWDPWPRFL